MSLLPKMIVICPLIYTENLPLQIPTFLMTWSPPREHKLSAVRYLVNGMTTYNLDPTSIQKEHDRLKQILLNDKYDTTILHKVNNKNREHENQNTKLAKFTYMGKEKRLITNLFKNTDIKIAFTTNNKIERLLSTQCNQIQNKYNKCVIYQLTCPSCNRKYIGQTDNPFTSDFKSTSETTNTWTTNPNSHNIC